MSPSPPAAETYIEPVMTGYQPSLPESHRSVSVPGGVGQFWRKLGAFAGPGYLVAVGYMDPGKWATDIAGGSRFGYTLLLAILFSNLMATVMPHNLYLHSSLVQTRWFERTRNGIR